MSCRISSSTESSESVGALCSLFLFHVLNNPFNEGMVLIYKKEINIKDTIEALAIVVAGFAVMFILMVICNLTYLDYVKLMGV